MNNDPEVSIIIPVYNSEEVIEETLESALHQTYDDYEVIVTDNKSTDNTVSIVEKYAENNSKLRVFRNEKNLGPVKNWKRCLEESRGEYIKILWSDDLMSDTFLEKTVDILKNDQEVAFVYSKVNIFGNNINKLFYELGRTGKYPAERFLEGAFLRKYRIPSSPGCALFRKKDVTVHEDIDNGFGLDLSETGAGIDVLIFLEALHKYGYFYFINEALSFFREHSGSITYQNTLYRQYNIARALYIKEYDLTEYAGRMNCIFIMMEYYFTRKIIGKKTLSKYYNSDEKRHVKVNYFFFLIFPLVTLIRILFRSRPAAYKAGEANSTCASEEGKNDAEVKVMFLVNIISPYRMALYNYMNDMPGISMKVVALADIEDNRNWKVEKTKYRFSYSILRGIRKYIWSRETALYVNWGLRSEIRAFRPDIVITRGYSTIPEWLALIYSKLFKFKLILWNGTTLQSSHSIKGVKGMLKKKFIKRSDGYVTYGTKSAEYLEYFGADTSRIAVGCNTVDTELFRQKTKSILKDKKCIEKRKKYPDVMLLFVGELIERKGLKNLLDAVNRLNNKDLGLFVVGTGSLMDDLMQYQKDNSIDNIYWEGYKQQKELVEYFALSDCLVMPSLEEVWGLVVNEALSSGLFVLSSDKAGATYDIVDQDNGRPIDPENIEDITGNIEYVVENIEEIRNRREKISKTFSENCGLKRYADAILESIRIT